jgi:hypothetical protein
MVFSIHSDTVSRPEYTRENLNKKKDGILHSEISGSHSGEYEDGCFWIVAPCSLVVVYRIAAFIIRAIPLMLEAASISGTSINVYQTTRRNNPEDSQTGSCASK